MPPSIPRVVFCWTGFVVILNSCQRHTAPKAGANFDQAALCLCGQIPKVALPDKGSEEGQQIWKKQFRKENTFRSDGYFACSTAGGRVATPLGNTWKNKGNGIHPTA